MDVTDRDIVAVRFPHRMREGRLGAEPLDIYLGLDPVLDTGETDVDVIIGEVKEGRAELNAGLLRLGTIAFALSPHGLLPGGPGDACRPSGS